VSPANPIAPYGLLVTPWGVYYRSRCGPQSLSTIVKGDCHEGIKALKSQNFFSKSVTTPEKPAKSWFNFRADAPIVSEEEAFLTILIGAARADDVVSPEESQELAALATRTKTLSSLTLARIAELQKHIEEKLEREGLQDVLTAACSSILNRTEQAEIVRMRADSVFAHAVDLVFADRVVSLSEQAYIEQLARQLAIDPDRARTIVSIIEIKNSY